MEAAQILDRVVARFIGTKHERDVKKLQPLIASMNAREAEFKTLSNEDLKLRFAELKSQVQEQAEGRRPGRADFSRTDAASPGTRRGAGLCAGA